MVNGLGYANRVGPVTDPTDLEVARRAARAGAAVVRAAVGGGPADFKGEVDPVTEADRAAEAAILSVLHSYRSDDAVLAEESGGGEGGHGRRWIVDPLDGTVNFLHGVPHVGVSVALYEDDRPLAGVVIDVFREEEFWAEAGAGAAGTSGRLRVSTRSPLGDALIATGFPYDRRRHGLGYGQTVGRVLERVRGVRRMGTACLDLAWVAAGRFDGFWEFQLAPWDLAAGVLLVEEAGGVVSDHRGGPAAPSMPSVVAANPLIQPELAELIALHVPDHLR